MFFFCPTKESFSFRRFFTSTLYIEGPAQREPWRGTHEAKSVRSVFGSPGGRRAAI